MAVDVPSVAEASARDPFEHARRAAETFGTLAVAGLLLLSFGLTSSVFLQPANLRNILVQVTVVGVVAIGETLVLLVGGLDLSVGANVLLGSVVAGDLVQRQGTPLWVGIAGGVLASTGIGLLNGILSAVIGIEPILATLGTFLLAGGIAKIVLHSSWIVVDDPFFADLVRTHVFWQLPLMVMVMFALYAVAAVAMRVTPFGRAVYAIGGNPRAARIAGLPAVRIRIVAFALAGTFAGVAGMLQIGQLGIISSGNAAGLEFQAITAALIGGLSVSAGGVGRVERTLLGAVIVGMITNYQTIRGVPPNYQQALLGGILLLAILADRLFPREELVRAVLDKRYLDAWFLAGMTVIAVVAFRFVEPSWLNGHTLQSIVTQNGPLALVAMAMTFSIISRHIDLSPGSMLALAGVVIGVVYRDTGSLALGLVAGLGLCVASGLVNGLLVSALGLNAIMVTLATYIWARGLALGFTNGDPVVVDTRLTAITNHTVGGFTIVAPIVVVAFVLGWFVLSKTLFGRYTHAMGGDPVGARRAGIRVGFYTTLIFVVMGVATWLASTIVLGQLASAQPYAAPSLELDAIIAVIIGGTRLAGGEGSLGRTLLGVAFISILNSGLLNLGLTDAYYQVYKGAALLAVLSAQLLLRRLAAEDVRRRQEAEQLLAEARGYA